MLEIELFVILNMLYSSDFDILYKRSIQASTREVLILKSLKDGLCASLLRNFCSEQCILLRIRKSIRNIHC